MTDSKFKLARPAPMRVHVAGYRAFDAVNGNTYCCAHIFIDGELVAHAPYEYGYGDYYLQAAGEAMRKAGIITQERHKTGGYDSVKRTVEALGHEFNYDVQDLRSERQLKARADLADLPGHAPLEACAPVVRGQTIRTMAKMDRLGNSFISVSAAKIRAKRFEYNPSRTCDDRRNHEEAAAWFASKLDWSGTYAMGGDGEGFVFVFVGEVAS